MLKFVMFVVVIVVAVVVIRASRKQLASSRLEWQRVAEAFGLSSRQASGFSTPSMHGSVDGFRVSVDVHTRGAGKSRSSWTRYKVSYRSLRMSLKLTREVPLLSSIAKVFGGEDHEVGSKDFDDRVLVKATDGDAVRAYLTPGRQRAVKAFLTKFSHAVIGDTSASGETSGTETSGERLSANIRQMVALARALEDSTSRRDEVRRAEPVRLDYAHLAPVVAPDSSPPPLPPPLPDPRRAAAAAVADLVGLAGIAAAARPTDAVPDGDAHDSADADGAAPVAAAPPPAKQDAVCEALFAGSSVLTDARAHFDDEYKGLFVHWTGRLRSVRHAYSELVFGSGEFTRAEVEIARVSAGVFGEREICAVLQLPTDARASLEGRDGEQITFEGDLVAIDPFMRHVFVGRGLVVE